MRAADLVRVRPSNHALAASLRAVAPELHARARVGHDGEEIVDEDGDRTRPWQQDRGNVAVRSGDMPIGDFVVHLLPKRDRAQDGAAMAAWWLRVADAIDAAQQHGYEVTITKHFRVMFTREALPFVPERSAGHLRGADPALARREIAALERAGGTRLRRLAVPDGSSRGLVGACVTRKNTVRGVLSRSAALAVLPLILIAAADPFCEGGVRR